MELQLPAGHGEATDQSERNAEQLRPDPPLGLRSSLCTAVAGGPGVAEAGPAHTAPASCAASLVGTPAGRSVGVAALPAATRRAFPSRVNTSWTRPRPAGRVRPRQHQPAEPFKRVDQQRAHPLPRPCRRRVRRRRAQQDEADCAQPAESGHLAAAALQPEMDLGGQLQKTHAHGDSGVLRRPAAAPAVGYAADAPPLAGRGAAAALGAGGGFLPASDGPSSHASQPPTQPSQAELAWAPPVAPVMAAAGRGGTERAAAGGAGCPKSGAAPECAAGAMPGAGRTGAGAKASRKQGMTRCWVAGQPRNSSSARTCLASTARGSVHQRRQMAACSVALLECFSTAGVACRSCGSASSGGRCGLMRGVRHLPRSSSYSPAVSPSGHPAAGPAAPGAPTPSGDTPSATPSRRGACEASRKRRQSRERSEWSSWYRTACGARCCWSRVSSACSGAAASASASEASSRESRIASHRPGPPSPKN
eukprot:scaffold27547_cov96-Isochrysis_galbana.AAC.3